MARISTNVPSLIARANLGRANKDLEVRLQRLSTGLRINRGADDPAGIIVGERLRSDIAGLSQGINNSERASSVIATAEGALSEVSDLLNSIKALVVEAANTGGLSDEERRANQLQIDSAIESITRISNSTSFGGLKLLNGELDYVLSGVATAAISKAQIHGANFAGQTSIQVQVDVVASAQTANLYLRGDYPATPAANGTLLSSVSLEIAGSRGVQVIEFLSGLALTELVTAINNFSGATGVTAALINPTNPASGVVFRADEYGSSDFVSVRKLADGDFFQTFKLPDDSRVPAGFSFAQVDLGAYTVASTNRDAGRDVTAIVNGVLASGDGLTLSVANNTSLSLELDLAAAFATANGSSTFFTITGGGATYQLGGEINNSQQINVALQSVAASRLGGTLINGAVQFLSSLKSGGDNDLNSRNFMFASDILQGSIDEISVVRGRLGALERNTLDTNVRSLQTAIENLTASQSRIRDADFAAETAPLTRAQILNSTSTSVLALANQQSQQVLSLLR